MSGNSRALAAALVLSLAAVPVAGAQRIELAAGAGAVSGLGQPGLDRAVGPTVMGAVEVRGHDRPLGLRLEVGFASQALSTRPGGLLTGDVQTIHVAAAVRVGPRSPESALAPYAIAGAAMLRHSLRTQLRPSGSAVPEGSFLSVTSEMAPGALIGGGVDWRVAGVRGFAEVRWLRSFTNDDATSTLPLIIGARLPLRD